MNKPMTLFLLYEWLVLVNKIYTLPDASFNETLLLNFYGEIVCLNYILKFDFES